MRLLARGRVLNKLVVVPHGFEETVPEQAIDVGYEYSLALLEIADLVQDWAVSFGLSI